MSTEAGAASDADYCAEQVRRHDHDRWLTALFAPEARRRGLLALYAFNLEVSRTAESVSEPMLGEIRLQWWRESVEEAARGMPRGLPVARELALALADRPASVAVIDQLLDARAQDLYESPPADIEALCKYAADTSAGLVELALDQLGATGPASREAGRQVGIAWALIGLVRSVPFHAARRKVFLPQNMLAAEGLDAEAVIAGVDGTPLRRVLARITAVAEARLADARRLRPERAALPALLPAALADLYARRLRRNDFAAAALAGQVPGPAKQMRLLRKMLLRRF